MTDNKKTISTLDPQKRATLRKLAIGTAFAIPLFASFSMNEVGVLKAQGYGGGSGGSGSGGSGGTGGGSGGGS